MRVECFGSGVAKKRHLLRWDFILYTPGKRPCESGKVRPSYALENQYDNEKRVVLVLPDHMACGNSSLHVSPERKKGGHELENQTAEQYDRKKTREGQYSLDVATCTTLAVSNQTRRRASAALIFGSRATKR